MALSTQQQNEAYQFFAIAFGATPGVEYMNQLDEAYSYGLTTKEIVNIYTTKPAFTAIYPTFFSNAQFADALIANVVGPSASNAAKAEARADIIAALGAGEMSRGDVIYAVFTNLAAKDPADPMWGNTATMLANKVAVSKYATEVLLIQGADQDVLDNVTADPASVTAAKALVDGSAGVPLQSLTVGLDNLSGGAGNNIFTAGVVQNINGEQTNQLATGDKINGGAGTDTLNAIVQAASPLNAGPSSAITPATVDVEVANFTALAFNQGENGGSFGSVVINAKFMNGLDKVGSIDSDVDLVVHNLNTLTDNGVYADRRNTKEMTIRFDHGSNDAVDQPADLVALFDNDYLVSDSSSTTTLEIRMVNNLTLANETKPLTNIEALSFAVDGVDVIVNITEANQGLVGTAAYQAVVDAIQAQLALQGITGVVASLLPERTTVFSDDVAPYLQGDLAGSYSPVLVTSTNGAITKGKVQISNTTTDFNGLNTQTTESATSENPVEVSVELLKVGRGGEGGELIIGGMATDLNNNWNFNDNSLEEGVQVFNVLMDGDRTQFSSLAGLYSTNNTLDTVNVVWAADSRADLIIGNQNTVNNRSVSSGAPNNAFSVDNDGFNSVTTVYNNALKDVRVFNAANNGVSAPVGNAAAVSTDVTLWAHLSSQVVAKYMDRTDIAAPAADNANFVYTFGAGNDTLNLNISKDNLAASGTSGREDFSFAVNTGAGNDTVVVQIGDGKATSTTPWYVNTTIQDNLSIVTGAGSDTVHANGAGVWNISTGVGNDVIYSDNSGRQFVEDQDGANVETNAVWVFNSANQAQGGFQGLYDLTSAAAVATVNKVANLELTLSYRGINVTVEVGDTHSALGGAVNDLTINQAIKNAINNNVYLKQLLNAQDGPGRTLIVTSKTDGVFSDADISVSLANPKAITVSQTGAGAAYLTVPQYTALGLTGGAAVVGGRFDSAIAEDSSAGVAETAVVTWTAFAAAGTQTIGGMTITATGAFTDVQVATVASGGVVAGLTITTAPTAWTVTSFSPNSSTFTSTGDGNVANVDAVAPTATGGGNVPPTAVTTEGTQVSITGAVSVQPNENVIDAGMGNDVVVLSTSAFAKEVVNVATVGGTAATDSDVVFNASAGASITYDAFDTIITSGGITIAGGVGTVNILTTGIQGSAGNDNINAFTAIAGQTIEGLAGNDTIIASSNGGTVIGGDGADVITFAANASIDTLVFNSLVGADTISGYVVANDSIQLSKAAFAALGTLGALAAADFVAGAGAVALDATDRIIYDTTTGALSYDADGSGVAAAVLLATFTGIPALADTEFTIVA